MGYLQLADAAAFGVSPDVTQPMLDHASLAVNGHLKRPEGLLYEVDANGMPLCMASLAARATLTLTTPIAPGNAVIATLSGPVQMLTVGDVLVAERGTANAEALIVQAVAGQQITFQTVKLSHAGAIALQYGCLIVEQKMLSADRSIARLSRVPLAAIVGGQGRYAQRRRGDTPQFGFEQFNLLATMTRLGGPPAWELFDASGSAVDPMTGQVWVSAGLLLTFYSEVRLHYVAGWPATSIPADIQQAVARIANVIAENPYNSLVQTERLDGISYSRINTGPLAGGSLIDQQTSDILRPYTLKAFA